MAAVDVIGSAVAAVNSGDVDGYRGHLDPGSRRWIVGFSEPLSLDRVGDGLREFVAAFDPMALSANALFGDSGSVCARWRLQGVQTGRYGGIAAEGAPIR